MWWGVLSELAETKNNLSAFNAKSKGGIGVSIVSRAPGHN